MSADSIEKDLVQRAERFMASADYGTDHWSEMPDALVRDLAAEIQRLRALPSAELERDAERYRWLRDRADMKFSGGLNGLKLAHTTLGAKHHGPQWDERIDAARAKEAKP